MLLEVQSLAKNSDGKTKPERAEAQRGESSEIGSVEVNSSRNGVDAGVDMAAPISNPTQQVYDNECRKENITKRFSSEIS